MCTSFAPRVQTGGGKASSPLDPEEPSLTSLKQTPYFHCTIARLAAAHTFLMAEISGHALTDLRELHPSWESRADLAIDSGGTILRNGRLLVPRPLRREVLKDLHSSHQGQSRTLQRARQVIFWPNMSNDIKNMVRSCDTCASFLPSQQQEPLHSHDIPVRPFQHVSADIFNASGCDFLVLVDHFSGWPSVAKLHNSTSTTNVLHQLKRWITDYGAPVKLVTDNGPQFRSAEFQHFCKEWYITTRYKQPLQPAIKRHCRSSC